MNESILTQLKILVERVVRPLRASTAHKNKMREELLAHVSATFEAELPAAGSEAAALRRVEERFGNPAELTPQLQESIPTLDFVRRYFENAMRPQPGDGFFRTAIKQAFLLTNCFLLLCVVYTVVWVSLVSILTLTNDQIGDATRAGSLRSGFIADFVLTVMIIYALAFGFTFFLILLTKWMWHACCEDADRPWLQAIAAATVGFLVIPVAILGIALVVLRDPWYPSREIPQLFGIAGMLPISLIFLVRLRRTLELGPPPWSWQPNLLGGVAICCAVACVSGLVSLIASADVQTSMGSASLPLIFGCALWLPLDTAFLLGRKIPLPPADFEWEQLRID